MNDMSKRRKSAFRRFIDGRGFYIVLLLCAAAIGVASYYAVTRTFDGFEAKPEDVGYDEPLDQDSNFLLDNEPDDGAQDVLSQLDGDQEDEPDKPVNSGTDTQTSSTGPATSTTSTTPSTGGGKTVTDSSTKASTVSDSTQVMKPEPKLVYLPPVEGAVIKEFSNGELVYSKSMNDWRVHDGVDYEGAEGSKVKSIADGTVEDVYYDEMLGWCVLIRHDSKTQSLYANLTESVVAEKGQAVSGGDVVGGIGRSAASEYADPPHLHLEVIVNGKRVNPLSIIK